MDSNEKKGTRRALKEKDTSYNARFVLRYQKYFDDSITENEEEQGLF